MSYYQGDFYAGDPGIFSFLGRAAGSLIRKVFPGGGGTRIMTTLPAAMPGMGGGIIPRVGGIVRRAGGVIAKHPVLSAAGAAGVVGAAGGMLARGGGAAGVERGFHISKRTGALVRNRRMRVTNPRALRRAIRRATGFARLAKRVLRFTSPRAPRGRAVFKARKRKRV